MKKQVKANFTNVTKSSPEYRRFRLFERSLKNQYLSKNVKKKIYKYA